MSKKSREVEFDDVLHLVLRFLLKHNLGKTAKKLIKESKLDLSKRVS